MKKFRVGQMVRAINEYGFSGEVTEEIIKLRVNPVNSKLISLLTEDEWDLFFEGKLAVNCKSKKIAREFLEECKRLEILWSNKDAISEDTCWQYYGEYTHYILCSTGLLYGDIHYYDNSKFISLPRQESKEFTIADVQTGMRAELGKGNNVGGQ